MKAIEQYFRAGAVYNVAQSGTTFWVYGCNSNVWSVQMKAIEKYFRAVLSLMLFIHFYM